ncbi:MAG TPA: helix-turn-helix domain-containing protein [Casimicrobiaceae bacterium]|jgi:DNA-binding transcriptional ArsR family regulator
MKDGPNIVGIAALIGDHARAEVLTALMTDRALTATELAAVAGVTKQTISAHLAKLLAAGLVIAERQGRHRYFRLADRDVAQLLESLMGVAFRTGALRLRPSPREPALRQARVCYDHLAGELGVAIHERLLARRALASSPDGLTLTATGHRVLQDLGIDTLGLTSQRRKFCHACMDWSERRHHLAGALGAALLARMIELGWVRRAKDSRVIVVAEHGRKALQQWMGGHGRAAVLADGAAVAPARTGRPRPRARPPRIAA